MKSDTDAAIPHKLLRIWDVEDLVGLTEASVYRRMKTGKFRAQVALNGRAVAWREADVLAWLESQPKLRRRLRPYINPADSLVPEGEPSPEMVRALLAKSGHTVKSAAEALGISRRTLERFTTNGSGWRRPRAVVLAALNGLPPPHSQRMLQIRRMLKERYVGSRSK